MSYAPLFTLAADLLDFAGTAVPHHSLVEFIANVSAQITPTATVAADGASYQVPASVRSAATRAVPISPEDPVTATCIRSCP